MIGPALAIWLVVNALPITFGRRFLLDLRSRATFHGNAGDALPVTYACALGLAGLPLVAYRALSSPGRIMVAAAIPFAFTHLYEAPYDLAASVIWRS